MAGGESRETFTQSSTREHVKTSSEEAENKVRAHTGAAKAAPVSLPPPVEEEEEEEEINSINLKR